MDKPLVAPYRHIFDAKKKLLLEVLGAMGFPERGGMIVITGCMCANKTRFYFELLGELWHHKWEDLLFKPKKDTRYGDEIGTFDGLRKKAYVLGSDEESLSGLISNIGGEEKLKTAKIIAFEEAELFSERLPILCHELVRLGKLVIIVGLNLNWKSQRFGPMSHLMATADEVVKLFAVCPTCGHLATHTQHYDGSGKPAKLDAPEIEIGVVGGSYSPTCRSCSIEERKKAGREISFK